MDFPRIAVVGAGNLSSRRIYPYLGAAGATLVGVCDLDLAKAERNAALFGGKPTEWREPPTFTSAGDSGHETGHLAELEDFVQAIREGRTTSRSSIFESYKTMVLYEAIAESARTGRPVAIRYEEP